MLTERGQEDWFEQIDKKFFPLDEASKDAYGEVEKNMILVRGAHLVTGKNQPWQEYFEQDR